MLMAFMYGAKKPLFKAIQSAISGMNILNPNLVYCNVTPDSTNTVEHQQQEVNHRVSMAGYLLDLLHAVWKIATGGQFQSAPISSPTNYY